MNEKETKSITCEKTGNHVTIERDYYIRAADQTGVVGKDLIDFECSEQMNCPFVSKDKGGNITFDWKNCPEHPDHKA